MNEPKNIMTRFKGRRTEIIIATAGLIIAIAAIYLPDYFSTTKECSNTARDIRSISSEHAQIISEANAHTKIISSSQEKHIALGTKIGEAKAYFEKEQNEKKVAEILRMVREVQKAARKKYGADFHSQFFQEDIGAVWRQFLTDQGFPKTHEECQALARFLDKIGADHETVYSVAPCIPAKQETVDLVIDGLGKLISKLETERDQYYSKEFQGHPNGENIINELQAQHQALSNSIDTLSARASELNDALRTKVSEKNRLCTKYNETCPNDELLRTKCTAD